jgi:hypothetical protein
LVQIVLRKGDPDPDPVSAASSAAPFIEAAIAATAAIIEATDPSGNLALGAKIRRRRMVLA